MTAESEAVGERDRETLEALGMALLRSACYGPPVAHDGQRAERDARAVLPLIAAARADALREGEERVAAVVAAVTRAVDECMSGGTIRGEMHRGPLRAAVRAALADHSDVLAARDRRVGAKALRAAAAVMPPGTARMGWGHWLRDRADRIERGDG